MKKPTKFYQRYLRWAPASYVAKVFAAEQGCSIDTGGLQIKEPPLFKCFRPPWAGGLPAPLAHPLFGRFLDEAADPRLVTRRDSGFVQEICDVSLRFYKWEKDRQRKLWELFSAYLRVPVEESFAVEGKGGPVVCTEDYWCPAGCASVSRECMHLF